MKEPKLTDAIAVHIWPDNVHGWYTGNLIWEEGSNIRDTTSPPRPPVPAFRVLTPKMKFWSVFQKWTWACVFAWLHHLKLSKCLEHSGHFFNCYLQASSILFLDSLTLLKPTILPSTIIEYHIFHIAHTWYAIFLAWAQTFEYSTSLHHASSSLSSS